MVEDLEERRPDPKDRAVLEIEQHLGALRRDSRAQRRKMEKMAAVSFIAAGLLIALVFLIVLKLSRKQPFDILLTFTMLAAALGLFARGLRDLVFGRK